MANSCNIFENIWFSCYQKLRGSQDNETVFVNFYGAQESVPRNRFHQADMPIGRLCINVDRNTSLYLQPFTDRGERRKKSLLKNLVAIFFPVRNRILMILRACNTRFVQIVFNLAKIVEFRVFWLNVR
jgi:hypothetical protein